MKCELKEEKSVHRSNDSFLKRYRSENYKFQKENKKVKKDNVALEQALTSLKDKLSLENEELRNRLSEEFHLNTSLRSKRNETIVIKKVKDKKGKMIWPLFVVKLILQLLAIGNRPSSTPENIAIQAENFCSKVIIEEVPSVVTVRRCRGMMRILSEMIGNEN